MNTNDNKKLEFMTVVKKNKIVFSFGCVILLVLILLIIVFIMKPNNNSKNFIKAV